MVVADPQTFERMKQDARRDDWHLRFVGSDIRQLLGEIERMRAVLETIAAGGAPNHPVTYPTPLACAADTIQNFMRLAREALGSVKNG